MKTTTYAVLRAYCKAYEDLLIKIIEVVEVARDCHRMSAVNMEALAYKKAATDILHDIAELTGEEV